MSLSEMQIFMEAGLEELPEDNGEVGTAVRAEDIGTGDLGAKA